MKPRQHPRQHHSGQDDQRLGQTHLAAPDPHPAASGAPEPPEDAGKPMKCVWSGYLDYNRDCRSRIPASVVVKAWHREIQIKGAVEGFFYFSWRNGVWLAYGLRDGRVRGVYCPTHSSQRNVREAQNELPESQGETSPAPPSEDPRIRSVMGSRPASEPAQAPGSDAPVAWLAYAAGRSSL